MRANFSIPVTMLAQASITRENAIKLAVDLIDEACDLKGGRYVTINGNLAFDYEAHGGPESWTETQIVRAATTLDCDAVRVIKALTA